MDIIDKLLRNDGSLIERTDLHSSNFYEYVDCPDVVCEIAKREMLRFDEDQRNDASYYLCFINVDPADASKYNYDLDYVMMKLSKAGFIDLGGFVMKYDCDGYYGVVTGSYTHCFNKEAEECMYEAIEVGLEECGISMAEIDYSIPEMIENIVRIKCPDTFDVNKNYLDRIKGTIVEDTVECIEPEVKETKQKIEEEGGVMDIFGLQFGGVDNLFNVQMDRDGNLGIDGRYVDSGDVLAELGPLVDEGCVKLIIIPTEINSIKTGDLFLYDGEALIVKKVDAETGSIDYYKGENVMRKALKIHPMLRKVMVSKLVNLYSMFDDVGELLPLMVYGENRVIDLITQQIVSGRKINLDEIEYQLNPVKAQTDLNRILAKVLELKI